LSGKFSGDGQYYDVIVEEVTDTGYKVLFTEYGNSEELPRTDLKQRDNSKALKELEARCAEAEARADRAEAALLENFDESESDAGDTLQEWRERCLRAEDAYAAMQKDGMRDKLEAQERITAELHAKLADADQRYNAEMSRREEAEAVVEELQTRPRTGTALDELAADLDEAQETLAEESERRQAAEAALAAKGGWSADLDRIRDAEARAEALGRELEDARLKAAALQAELDAPSELDALAGELRAEAAVATHLADLHPEIPQEASMEKFDEEWRQLEDEHNDLLALLAQQELEKTAMAELLSSRIGPEAVVEVKEKARVDCEARYGTYVDYAQDDVHALQRAEEELEGFVAAAEEVVAPVM
jgi:hypothetical protein